MPKKGERMTDEQKVHLAEARRLSRERKMQEAASAQNYEDVSLPTGYGSAVELEEEAHPLPPVSDPADPYAMWLLTLDRETREMFTAEELRATFDEYWARAQAEKKTKKKKEIADLALSTARSQMGLLPAQTVESLRVARQNAKPVSMMVQMPPAQDDGGPADIGLRVNGQVIPNGKRHFCTYGEAASLREMLYRHGQAELLFKGSNMRYRAYLLGQALGSVNTQIDANERGGR
jgi:hypothetical protein